MNRRKFLRMSGVTAGACLLAPGIAAAVDDKSAHDGDFAMLNDSVRCVGCRGCQNACKQHYGLDRVGDEPMFDRPQALNADNYCIIKLNPDADRSRFVKQQCMHCIDPACASVCPVKALKKTAAGPVTYDPNNCIGCRYCMVACPFNVPTFEYESPAPKIQKCSFCADDLAAGRPPKCAEVCPAGAITFGTRRQLLDEARARVKADPERYNQAVYGENEVGGTSVLYVAGVDFASLGLPALQSEPLPDLPESIQHGIFKYFVTPVALFGMLAVARGATIKCEPGDHDHCLEE